MQIFIVLEYLYGQIPVNNVETKHFESQVLGHFEIDQEYEFYLDRWLEYRRRTEPYSCNARDIARIKEEIFSFLPKNEYFFKAKIDSLRLYETGRY